MAKNKTILIALVVLVLSAILVYGFIQLTKLQNSNVAPSQAGAKMVLCDVSIHNPIGFPLIRNGDLYIESANCQQQYVKNCGAIFGLFSDTGSLSIAGIGGQGSSASVDVPESKSASYQLNWCGATLTNTFKITLRNDNNAILQQKDVTI